jgi:hypothetical protein
VVRGVGELGSRLDRRQKASRRALDPEAVEVRVDPGAGAVQRGAASQ